jgi:hypothetical protein
VIIDGLFSYAVCPERRAPVAPNASPACGTGAEALPPKTSFCRKATRVTAIIPISIFVRCNDGSQLRDLRKRSGIRQPDQSCSQCYFPALEAESAPNSRARQRRAQVPPCLHSLHSQWPYREVNVTPHSTLWFMRSGRDSHGQRFPDRGLSLRIHHSLDLVNPIDFAK